MMNNCSYDGFMLFLQEKEEKEIKNNPWEYVANLAIQSGKYYDDTQNYVCKEDKELIEKYNESVKDEHKFQLDILPVPFEGDVFNAKIIILTLNPGFIKGINHSLYSMFNDDSQKKITNYHIENLKLKCKRFVPNDAVNFIGDRYWSNKTKELIEKWSFELSDIALIQYIGYQSKEFYETKSLKGLKSVEFTKLLIEYLLQTRKDDYCFVIARKENMWNEILNNINEATKNNVPIICLKNKRNTTISEGNMKQEDWEIIKRLKSKKLLFIEKSPQKVSVEIIPALT